MKPTRGLLQGMPYTPAAKTDIRKLFRKARAEMKAQKEAAERNIFRIVQKARA